MAFSDRAHTPSRLAAFAVSLLACGGQVGGRGQADGGPPATQFVGYVTAAQLSGVSQENPGELLFIRGPSVLPFLGSCAADNEVVVGCCYAPTTPSRGEGSALAGALQVDPGGGVPALSLMGYLPSGYALAVGHALDPGGRSPA